MGAILADHAQWEGEGLPTVTKPRTPRMDASSHNPSTEAAFTLVELLVVVSIIALLIAILLPSLKGARDQAKATLCLSNVRQMGIASAMYSDSNNDYYPLTKHGEQDAVWIKTLQPYAGNDLLFRCPSDRSTDWFNPTDPPDVQLENDRKSSYGVNIYFSPEVAPPLGAPDPTPRYGFVRRDLTPHPQQTVHFGENVETKGYEDFADHIHADQWIPNPLTGTPTSEPEESVALERHRKKANYTFADAHAEPLAFDWTFKLNETKDTVLHDHWNPKGKPK